VEFGDYLSVLSHGLITANGTGDYLSVLSHGLLLVLQEVEVGGEALATLVVASSLTASMYVLPTLGVDP
jgi:hypothetical protein